MPVATLKRHRSNRSWTRLISLPASCWGIYKYLSLVRCQSHIEYLSDFLLPDDEASVNTYYSVIFGLYNLLFVDGMTLVQFSHYSICSRRGKIERTSTNTLHTVELKAFYENGGFDELLRICNSLAESIEEITRIREEERTDIHNETLIHAYGGLKVALHLLHPIISSKPLTESPQTLLLTTRDKKETDPGFFDPSNFLVKLRLKVLPLFRSLWEAPWFIHAPLGVSRSIVRSVLELVNGENEQYKPETTSEAAIHTITRPTGPDESRVQMLVDMGFPRSAAERALVHTRNNVTAATDFLLNHPFVFPPEHGPINTPPIASSSTASGEVEAIPPADIQEQSAGEGTVEGTSAQGTHSQMEDETGHPKEGIKTIEEWKNALDEAREPLRNLVSRQALLLLDEHQSLLFELHTAFVRPSVYQPRAVHDLVDDVKSFSPYAYDVQEQPLANRCRLLALVLSETPSSLDESLRKELLDGLLALLLSGMDLDNPPKWLASHLLVTEALLILAEEPRTIIVSVPKEDEPVQSEALVSGLPRADAKNIIFEFVLRLLPLRDLPSDELLSVLRLLVYFTKDRKMVKQFLESEGLTHLFCRIGASEVTGGSSYIITVLRHVIEDRSTVQKIMTESIKRFIQHQRNSTVDVNAYVRNCNAMAFRDTNVFLDVTKSLCDLDISYYYGFSPQLGLKSDKKDSVKTAPEDSLVKEEKNAEIGDVEMKPEQPTFELPDNQHAENVIRLLFTELAATVKSINEASALGSPTKPPTDETGQVESSSPILPSNSSTSPTKVDEKLVPPARATEDKYQYACFLMQCLTELIFSYDACKVAFLSFVPKKKNQTPSKESASKFRSVTLQFLFNDVINPGTINPTSSDSNRSHLSLCHWAMLVVVSLCVDTSTSPHEPKDISPELVAVRKFVLETLSRNLKDISSIESLEVRYGKLMAFSDLCHRLLTVRFNHPNTNNRKHQDEIPTHIAKIMLEKSFVSTLTSALSDVDLNYPHIRTLVDFILRPLQYL
jgi:E3 ubiquitin-protein ligase HUWE1